MEKLRLHFDQLFKDHDGLLAIIFSDRDGVPIYKQLSPQAKEQANVLDYLVRSRLLPALTTVAEQSPKLQLQDCTRSIIFYTNYQLIQLFRAPVYVTLMATATANSGLLLKSLDTQLLDVADAFKTLAAD